MNRREFIRDVLLWSAGLSVSIPRFTVPEVFAAPPSPLLAVDKGTDYVKLVNQVLSSLGGMNKFARTDVKAKKNPRAVPNKPTRNPRRMLFHAAINV